MPLTKIEKFLCGGIIVLCLWAWAWVHLVHAVRGPFSYPSLSEKAEILHELPQDWQNYATSE